MTPPVRTYTGGDLQCNGYLVVGVGGECVAIDAPEGFAEWIQRSLPPGECLTHLLLTHQHFDHTADAALLQRTTGCAIHAAFDCDSSLSLAEHAAMWGIPRLEAFSVERPLGKTNSVANWAGLDWRVLPLPGHSTDGMAYYLPEQGILFSGDSLFAGSIGRTDLPGGNLDELLKQLREKLFSSLPPKTRVYPGHGPYTTLGEELINNPYIA